MIYVITGADDVFAVSVETGKILWSYEANLDQTQRRRSAAAGPAAGVGLGDGKVFVGQLDGKLVALDQKTGKVAWSMQAERWQDGYTITNAPLVLQRHGDHRLRRRRDRHPRPGQGL